MDAENSKLSLADQIKKMVKAEPAFAANLFGRETMSADEHASFHPTISVSSFEEHRGMFKSDLELSTKNLDERSWGSVSGYISEAGPVIEQVQSSTQKSAIDPATSLTFAGSQTDFTTSVADGVPQMDGGLIDSKGENTSYEYAGMNSGRLFLTNAREIVEVAPAGPAYDKLVSYLEDEHANLAQGTFTVMSTMDKSMVVLGDATDLREPDYDDEYEVDRAMNYRDKALSRDVQEQIQNDLIDFLDKNVKKLAQEHPEAFSEFVGSNPDIDPQNLRIFSVDIDNRSFTAKWMLSGNDSEAPPINGKIEGKQGAYGPISIDTLKSQVPVNLGKDSKDQAAWSGIDNFKMEFQDGFPQVAKQERTGFTLGYTHLMTEGSKLYAASIDHHTGARPTFDLVEITSVNSGSKSELDQLKAEVRREGGLASADIEMTSPNATEKMGIQRVSSLREEDLDFYIGRADTLMQAKLEKASPLLQQANAIAQAHEPEVSAKAKGPSSGLQSLAERAKAFFKGGAER